jgi:PAS domain-containing protein
MLIQDLDTILFANAITRGYFGAVDRSELEGRSILSIIHPDGMLSTMERVAFVFATHQRIREVPIKLKRLDGGIVHAVSDAYPIRAEGRWGALIVGEVVREEDTASRR